MCPEDTNRDGPGEQKNADNAAPAHADPIQPRRPQPAVRNPAKQLAAVETARQEEAEISDEELVDRIRKSDRLMIALTAIITAATVWQAYITSQGGEQTERMVVATEGMKKALVESVVQEKENFAKSIEENRKTLDASLRSGKAVLDANIASFRQEQRAWLSFGIGIEPNAASKQFRIVLPVINSGRTPAFRVRFQALVKVTPDTLSFPPEKDWAQAPTHTLGVIHPAEQGRRMRIDDLPAQAVERYRAGERLYVFIKLYYCDAFGKSHWIRHCAYHATKEGNFFVYCGTDTDRESSKLDNRTCQP